MGQFSYRKKPVVIEAWQFRASGKEASTRPYPDWLVKAVMEGVVEDGPDGAYCKIKTDTHGIEHCNDTDWIIRGIEGELYPCKDSVFQAIYEKVE